MGPFFVSGEFSVTFRSTGNAGFQNVAGFPRQHLWSQKSIE
jgi:hypothetical protein